MVELVDTRDLKSLDSQTSCRFDSGSWHIFFACTTFVRDFFSGVLTVCRTCFGICLIKADAKKEFSMTIISRTYFSKHFIFSFPERENTKSLVFHSSRNGNKKSLLHFLKTGSFYSRIIFYRDVEISFQPCTTRSITVCASESDICAFAIAIVTS